MQDLNKQFNEAQDVNDGYVPDSDTGAVGDITDNLAGIEDEELQQIAGLESKLNELKDSYLRSQAEVQNIQRRSQEEIKKARDYAVFSFVKDIVVVKDYLEMALKDESGNFEAIKTGVDLTLKQLVQVFERQLIKEIEPKERDKLDPHLHQAMSCEEVANQEPNTIVKVLQKGYILNERVIRPAMVIVAK